MKYLYLFLIFFNILGLENDVEIDLPPDIGQGDCCLNDFQDIEIDDFVNVDRGIKKNKIIGLMQVRNEAAIVEVALRSMAVYTDSIIVLDDNSTDDTLAIVKNLAKDLNIERIIENSQSAWLYKTELDNKQALIDAARALGGTHFIHLDADEILTANCATDNWLRNRILSLKPGQVISLRMIHLWKGVDYYRDDNQLTPRNLGITAFMCDDGVCNMKDNKNISNAGFIHIGRLPITKNIVNINDSEHYIMHFKFVNFEFLKIKIAWYMCLERIRLNENLSGKQSIRTVEDINKSYNFYQPCFKDEHIVLRPLKTAWLNYSFFKPEPFFNQHLWRKKEIKDWFNKFGIEYFRELNIWGIGIDWN